MPCIVDRYRVGRPNDRRIKLSKQDKADIPIHYKNGMAIRAIARLYGVDKRGIQFILFPDRKEKNLLDRLLRGGSRIYYDKDNWRKTMREHRAYKKKLLEEAR